MSWTNKWNRIKYKIQHFNWREYLIEDILDGKFIVNENREFGFRILGVNCYYYKRSSPIIYEGDAHDDGSPMLWRKVSHREFGECLYSPYNFEPTETPKYPEYGEEYKLNEQWDLVGGWPVPKFVIEEIKKQNRR